MHKTSLSLLLGFLALNAYGQVETSTSVETTVEDTSGIENSEQVEKVEVTGSLIKRVDVEGPGQVQTLDKKFIQNTGWNNLGDVMRDLSANSFGVNADSGNPPASSAQFSNLRGLGADRTLVLINGRMAPKDAGSAAFDMSLIPISAVKRVDIMKDAGSALYGTDALGGVINIITNKDFNGFEFSTDHFQAAQEGGNRSTIGMTYGKSTSRSNFTTSFQVRNNTNIKSRDRELTNFGVSFNTPVPNYVDSNGDLRAAGDCSTAQSTSTTVDPDTGLNNCLFKYADFSDETPLIRQINNVTNFDFDLSSTTKISGTFLGSFKDVESEMAPGVVQMVLDGDAVDSLGTLPGRNPGEDTFFAWRSLALGNRKTRSEDLTLGGNVGITQAIGDTWDVSLITGYSRTSRNTEQVQGYANEERLRETIESGQYNIITGEGTIGDDVRLSPFQETVSDLATAEVRATGDLFDGWAGPIGMAVGAGYTYESISITTDEESLRDNVTGGGAGTVGEGSRGSIFAVAEVLVPLASKLEMQAAVRFDRFDSFGNTINPKLGFAYRPFKSLLLRASAGTGFKAPNLVDMFGESEGYPTFNAYGSGGNGQHLTRYVGNENLDPETSTNFSVGVVFEPASFLSFNVDAYDITIDDAITLPDAQDIADDDNAGINIEEKWGVTRFTDASGGPGYIISYINSAQDRQRGLDFGTRLNADLGKAGRIALQNDATYLFKYTRRTNDGIEASFLQSRGAPKWRNRANLMYAPLEWLSFDTTAVTTGSHYTQNRDKKFNMFSRIDMAVTISQLFGANNSLRIGVQDLLEDKPPHNLDNVTNPTVTSLYDYTGRRFFAAYRQTF